MANKRSWKSVKVRRNIEAKEMFECVVRSFGIKSGHIPFSGRYVGKKVIVIPIER